MSLWWFGLGGTSTLELLESIREMYPPLVWTVRRPRGKRRKNLR